MFITKEILNKKQKKMKNPHIRQIFSQIHQSEQSEEYQFNKFVNSHQKTISRPKTSQTKKRTKQKSNNILNYYKKRPQTSKVRIKTSQVFQDQIIESNNPFKRSNSFMNKIDYKINQMTAISQNFNRQKQTLNQNRLLKNFGKNQKINQFMKQLHLNIQKKEKKLINKFYLKQYSKNKKGLLNNDKNHYLGFFKQKLKQVLPCKKLKNQNFKMFKRCITGGYIDDFEQFSTTISKNEVQKLKNKFITFQVVYNGIKGNKNKGIQNIKPNQMQNQNLKNIVYYLENQNQFNICQKKKLKNKIKICD